MIRDASYDDYSELLRLVTNLLNANGYYDVKETMLKRMFTRCVMGGFAKVIEVDGSLRGLMFGMATENLWGVRCANELICYSTMQTPLLLRAYRKWAVDNKLEEITVTNTFGNSRYERMLNALGFKPISKTYRAGV